MALEKIKKANDIKALPKEEIPVLCDEIREFLIESISVTGGHLASNLGVVELTVALHLAFDPEQDKIIWDVGHQSYTHKILTGRKNNFNELRKYGGISGFPKRKESICDPFDTGHSSTSISAGLGYAAARELTGEDYRVITVIGDGALTGGMSYEAMNNASKLKKNFIMILNDNKMSISENVGGMSRYLARVRTAGFYRGLKSGVKDALSSIPVYGDRIVEQISRAKNGIKSNFVSGMYFENMGIIYLGPIDGSDVETMVKVFKEAQNIDGPVLIHVITKKGKGFLPAERHPARFHGAEPFDIETGLPKKPRTKANYTDVFSTIMRKMGDRNQEVVAITAAMEDGTGLKRFHNLFPDRFFDVGIAEQHAVTFAAGLAAAGLIPVFAVYSSFLQRAYDQILHDVCIQNLHVVFAIDRAGIVGSDGETHQGIFDISYLSTVPNLVLMAPKNKWELSDMMKYAVAFPGPIAIRYPRGLAYDGLENHREQIAYGKSEMIYEESEIALFAYGSMVKTAEIVRERLKEQGHPCTLINARFAKPFDEECIDNLVKDHKFLVVLEENVLSGGLGEHVAEYVESHEIPLRTMQIAIPDCYVEHGNVDILRKEVGIDEDSIVKRIRTEFYGETL